MPTEATQGPTLPIVAAGDAKALLAACQSGGMFYLVEHGIDSAFLDRVLEETRQFFDLDEKIKQYIHIKKSTNHRGWGMLKNYRDWREQIHIGVEAEADARKDLAQYMGLWGPNQWPNTGDDSYKKTMLAYMDEVEALSRQLLTKLARGLDKPDDFFTARMGEHPYLLIKAIAYLPQVQNTEVTQTGVPAHCDWSWLTLLLQDDVGGLEAQDKDGNWYHVKPLAGALVVNTGELLEIETGGAIRANPHRVVNERIDRRRFSVPLFINAALDATIYPAGGQTPLDNIQNKEQSTEHVHKVIKPGSKLSPFIFGDSEYRRKHEGLWCYRQQCLGEI